MPAETAWLRELLKSYPYEDQSAAAARPAAPSEIIAAAIASVTATLTPHPARPPVSERSGSPNTFSARADKPGGPDLIASVHPAVATTVVTGCVLSIIGVLLDCAMSRAAPAKLAGQSKNL